MRMNITNRQQQIMISLLTGSRSLPTLLKLPAFSEVTERTLQRDLSELVENSLVNRDGEARAIVYAVSIEGKLGLTLPNQELEKFLGLEFQNTQTVKWTLLKKTLKNSLT